MNKTILSACGAFISTVCAIASLAVYSTTDEALCALFSVFFAFLSLAFVGWGIEGSEFADFLSDFFAERGGER